MTDTHFPPPHLWVCGTTSPPRTTSDGVDDTTDGPEGPWHRKG